MNNAIWMGISVSLLTAVASASKNCTTEATLANQKVQIRTCSDGRLHIKNQDGAEVYLSPETLKLIEKLQVEQSARHDKNRPCIGRLGPSGR